MFERPKHDHQRQLWLQQYAESLAPASMLELLQSRRDMWVRSLVDAGPGRWIPLPDGVTLPSTAASAALEIEMAKTSSQSQSLAHAQPGALKRPVVALSARNCDSCGAPGRGTCEWCGRPR